MLSQILKLPIGTQLTLEQDKWLRGKLRKLNRYRNLEPHCDYFTVGKYKNVKMILAWKLTKPNPIPLPSNQLASNKSTKTRVLNRLRKVVEYQLEPLRVPGKHVDHVYPFSLLVDDWLKLHKLSYSKVRSHHYKSFCEYHKLHATYQLLTPEENLKKGAKYVG